MFGCVLVDPYAWIRQFDLEIAFQLIVPFHLQSAIACLCLSDLTWSKRPCFQLLFSGVWSAPWIRWVWCVQVHLFREAKKAVSLLNQSSRTLSVWVGIFCLWVESRPRRDAAKMEAQFEMKHRLQMVASATRHVLPVTPPHLGPRGLLNATDWCCNLANAKWAWRVPVRIKVSVHLSEFSHQNLLHLKRRPSRTFALAAFGRKANSFKTSKGQQKITKVVSSIINASKIS